MSDTDIQEAAPNPSGAMPTPNSMPGAQPAADRNPVEPEGDSDSGEVTISELERLARALGGEDGLRNILQGERRWERRAKESAEKARKFDEIEASKKTLEERLIAERDDAQRLLAAERTERIREKIARETGVPPEQINGADEDAMRESAEKALAWANSVRKATATLTPPASTVTGDGKPPTRPGQILSRDELKKMTPQEIIAADREGRLDHLKGIQS